MADLSELPQVDAVVRDPDAESLIAGHGRRMVTDAVREVIDDARGAASEGDPIPDVDQIIHKVATRLENRHSGHLRRVINATGVVVHTNLGRAPLSAAARDALDAATGYCSLEYDLAAGRRGSRTKHLGTLAAAACEAEAATVVNNGAAALVLVLSALSAEKEAVVSRGELVEIGGSFRLPDVMASSGAIMREIGTTNRTRVDDYRAAAGDDTGLLLKVHRSNYRVVGFTTDPAPPAIADVAAEVGVPFVYDIGSGLLRDGPPSGAEGMATDRDDRAGRHTDLGDEPAAVAALAAGADLVIFSGDKLLGGPQAGVIAGRADLVERCGSHPLARALRIDKFRRAALESTLKAHLRADVPDDVPVWRMLTADLDDLRDRAQVLAERVGSPAIPSETVALTGGGSLPGTELDSWAIRVDVHAPDALADELRRHDPPVIVRVSDDAVWLDVRTIATDEDDTVADAVSRALDRLAAR